MSIQLLLKSFAFTAGEDEVVEFTLEGSEEYTYVNTPEEILETFYFFRT